jgi:hypothetical protein
LQEYITGVHRRSALEEYITPEHIYFVYPNFGPFLREEVFFREEVKEEFKEGVNEEVKEVVEAQVRPTSQVRSLVIAVCMYWRSHCFSTFVTKWTRQCHGRIQRGVRGVGWHPYVRNPVGHSSVLGTALMRERREEKRKKRREDEKSGKEKQTSGICQHSEQQ